jgi:hypothetical protein
MRRYFFYFAFALLTFWIGSFIAIDFSNNATQEVVNIVPMKTDHDEIVFGNSPDEELLQLKMDSFKPIIGKWLRGEKINQYVELERNDDASIGEYSAGVNLIDVNGDRIEELAIQTGCAIVGNCEFWLFQKDADTFRKILEADMVQSYRLKKSKTNGYFDLETKSHGSATSGGIAIYKFNGHEYKIEKCFWSEYELIGIKNGKGITKEKPTLTSMPCQDDSE